MSTDNLNLPIIDLSKLDSESTQAEFYKELRHLARDIGFFYLVGHGIPQSERDDLLDAAKKFFALPQDVKDKISMDHSPHFRGYTKTGRETTGNKADYREQLDFGHEVPKASYLPEDDPHFYENLQGPNQWPDEVPELRERVLAYQEKGRAVLEKLLRAFLVALDQPEDAFDEVFSGTPTTLLKLVRYPANTGEKGKDQEQGVGPHKDTGFFAFLYQDDVGGLQVYTEENGWIDAPPVKDAYVINIGEALELATNGYLRANVHQVVMKPNIKKDRYSIPFFTFPSVHCERLPLLKLSDELQEQARGPTSDPQNPLFSHQGKNYIKSRLRSHLGTTERFYPKSFALIQEKGNI